MKFLATCFLFMFCSVAVANDNIVIVFDTSGSMNTSMKGGKTRLQTAQEALINVLSKVPESTNVGVLSFNGWIYDLSPVDLPKLKNAIQHTGAAGGTPLYQYIAVGTTRLLQKRNDNGNAGSYKLLVVSDGEAGDASLNRDGRFRDGSVKLGVLKDVLSRGIIVDAIGLDMEANHPLSLEINGSYMRGNDSNSLTKAIAKSVAEVGFGATKDASDESFREISELPENFVQSSLKGLTTFQNQPIGEQPPKEVQPVNGEPTSSVTPSPSNTTNSVGNIFTIGLVSVAGLFVLVLLFSGCCRG